MLIFSRILDFRRTVLARLRDKRRHPRYRVGLGFPLKASLSLVGSSTFNAERALVRGSGVHWAGVVGDIATNGLSILLSPAATTVRGESTFLRLAVENHGIVIPCTVAHFRVYYSHVHCGVHLEFDDFKAQKSYLQIVEAVKIGSSFKPAASGRTSSGLISRGWRSTGRTHLTEWREISTRTLDRFELTLNEHTVLGRRSQPGLVVRLRQGGTKSVPPAVEEEVRQLFRWVVANLPKNVPADLREFMARAGGHPPAASGPAAWQAPSMTVRATTSIEITAPPGVWQARALRIVADPVP